jgi:hypothetical protein
MTRPLAVASVALLVSACVPGSGPPAARDDAAVRAAIEAIYQAENRAMEAGDSNPMRQFMASNLVLIAAGCPSRLGRERRAGLDG